MGCTGSSLKGDADFKNIDATLSSKPAFPSKMTRSDPTESSLSQEAYAHATPPISPVDGAPQEDESHRSASSHLDNLASTNVSKPPSTRKIKKPFIEVPSDSPDLSVRSVEGTGEEDAMVNRPRHTLRTDEERMLPDPVTGKKPGLYARYKTRQMGRGEERDPITGRGALTGMTKEEIIAYVERTRGAGVYSGRQYSFMSAGDGAAWTA